MAVHHHRGLAVKPWQVVVGAATMHRVKGRCCGQNVRCGGVQLVAIVTCVYNMHSTPQGTVSMGIIASRHFTYCMHSIARCIWYRLCELIYQILCSKFFAISMYARYCIGVALFSSQRVWCDTVHTNQC